MVSTLSLRRNTVINLIGALLPLSVSVIVIPFFLREIGQSRYGIISLVWLLFGYFGLFDLGLSHATTNFLARPLNQSALRQAQIFRTATVTNFLLGALGAAVFAVTTDFILKRMVTLPATLLPEMKAAELWVACLLPLSTTASVFTGALEAHERFFELNVVQVIGAALGQIVPLTAVTLYAPRIDVAIVATVSTRICTTLVLYRLAVRQCCSLNPGWQFKPAVARELLKYGGWVTVSNIAGPILVSVDQFMIGAILGVATLPVYSIPFNVATRILLVPAAITRAVFPKLTKLEPHDAHAKAAEIAVTVTLALAIICIPLIALTSWGLTEWMGADFSLHSRTVSRIIILGVCINGLAYVPFTLLQSQGKPNITARLHVYELLPYLGLLWLALHYIGLIGAALAWSIRVLIDAVLLLRAARLFRITLHRTIPPIIALVLSFLISVAEPHIGFPLTAMWSCILTTITFAYAVHVDTTFHYLFLRLRALTLRWNSS